MKKVYFSSHLKEGGNEKIPDKEWQTYTENICGEDQRVLTYKGKRYHLSIFKKKRSKNERK